MVLGAATLALNSRLVSNLLKNLKKRRHLSTHEDKEAPPTLNGLTLAIPINHESENLNRFLLLLNEQRSVPEKILFLKQPYLSNPQDCLDKFCEEKNYCEQMMGSPIPEGHSPKNWALRQLLDKVHTEFVLFMDTDVCMTHPRALFSLYEETLALRKGRYSFATVYPRPKAKVSASILVNQLFVQLYYFLPHDWHESKIKYHSTGSGQIMMANTHRLKTYNFLEKITHAADNGLQLAQLFKAKEGTTEYFDGGALFQSDYFPSFWKAFQGTAQTAISQKNSRALSLAYVSLFFWAFVVPFIFLPFAILNPCWIAALFVILWGQYRLMQELDLEPLFILSTPLASSLFCISQLWGIVNQSIIAEFKAIS